MSHSPNPGFKPGDRWVECDRCGFDVYFSQTSIDPVAGIRVCSKCLDEPERKKG